MNQKMVSNALCLCGSVISETFFISVRTISYLVDIYMIMLIDWQYHFYRFSDDKNQGTAKTVVLFWMAFVLYLLATMSGPDETLKSISWNEFFYDMLSKGEVGARNDDCDYEYT